VSRHRPLVKVATVAIICAGLWALWYFGKPGPKAGVVRAYCGYYSNVLTKDAEYNGCLKHVTFKLVEDRAYRGSEAALCALGWGDCFYDDEVLDRGEQPGFNKQRYDNTPKDLVRPDDGRQNPNGQYVESKTPW
jgi:hypothetical protein